MNAPLPLAKTPARKPAVNNSTVSSTPKPSKTAAAKKKVEDSESEGRTHIHILVINAT